MAALNALVQLSQCCGRIDPHRCQSRPQACSDTLAGRCPCRELGLPLSKLTGFIPTTARPPSNSSKRSNPTSARLLPTGTATAARVGYAAQGLVNPLFLLPIPKPRQWAMINQETETRTCLPAESGLDTGPVFSTVSKLWQQTRPPEKSGGSGRNWSRAVGHHASDIAATPLSPQQGQITWAPKLTSHQAKLIQHNRRSCSRADQRHLPSPGMGSWYPVRRTLRFKSAGHVRLNQPEHDLQPGQFILEVTKLLVCQDGVIDSPTSNQRARK